MSNKPTACFEFQKTSFSWANGRTILKKQSFCIPVGHFTVLRGPSGSGKSTILRMLNRLEEPQSGEILYRGTPLRQYDPPQLRRKVGYLQQTPVVPDLTVRETLLMPFKFNVNKELVVPSDDDLVSRLESLLLHEIDLNDRAAALSGGQRQRLCLARLLMSNELDVLLLDEPTAALDKESKASVEQLSDRLCAQGMTVVMVTHHDFSPLVAPKVEIKVQDGEVRVCL